MTLTILRLCIATLALAALVAVDIHGWVLSSTVSGLLGAVAWGILPPITPITTNTK